MCGHVWVNMSTYHSLGYLFARYKVIQTFNDTVSCHAVSYQFSKPAKFHLILTLKVLVTTTDAQWEGVGDIGSARYEPALLPPCPTVMVLNYSN